LLFCQGGIGFLIRGINHASEESEIVVKQDRQVGFFKETTGPRHTLHNPALASKLRRAGREARWHSAGSSVASRERQQIASLLRSPGSPSKPKLLDILDKAAISGITRMARELIASSERGKKCGRSVRSTG
jgi:hypothetical protein